MKKKMSKSKRAKALRKMRSTESVSEKKARRSQRNEAINAWKRRLRKDVNSIIAKVKSTSNQNRIRFIRGVLKENNATLDIEGKKY